MMVYATAAEYEQWTGKQAPDRIELQLENASDLIDSYLLTAVYTVDDYGMPTNPRVARALSRAVCAQVAAGQTDSIGGSDLAAAGLKQSSIGGVNLVRDDSVTASSSVDTSADLTDEVARILKGAGLLSNRVYVW